MRIFLMLGLLVLLCGCVKAGEFTPETNKLYELGKPNCEKVPERCHKGVPW